ncbi:MAG: sigma-70 family RNA polymerase sigma factor [Firmicutes bacterium]|nr:sigma-70 family RNA polymerase sigma factor [Bacillota bacterium]
MSILSEKENILISHCQAGDLQAYDKLMQRYEKKVYALCYRMSGNPDDAADLAQESFLKAFRALPSFKKQASFSTWLFRIVTNTCLDERRKQKKRAGLISLDKPIATEEGEMQRELTADASDPLTEAIRREAQTEIQILLSKLPPTQRAVIIMRDLQGFSYEEIAASLQINMGTLKSRLNRARSRLRQLYLQKEEQNTEIKHLRSKGGMNYDMF